MKYSKSDPRHAMNAELTKPAPMPLPKSKPARMTAIPKPKPSRVTTGNYASD